MSDLVYPLLFRFSLFFCHGCFSRPTDIWYRGTKVRPVTEILET